METAVSKKVDVIIKEFLIEHNVLMKDLDDKILTFLRYLWPKISEAAGGYNNESIDLFRDIILSVIEAGGIPFIGFIAVKNIKTGEYNPVIYHLDPLTEEDTRILVQIMEPQGFRTNENVSLVRSKSPLSLSNEIAKRKEKNKVSLVSIEKLRPEIASEIGMFPPVIQEFLYNVWSELQCIAGGANSEAIKVLERIVVAFRHQHELIMNSSMLKIPGRMKVKVQNQKPVLKKNGLLELYASETIRRSIEEI
jgi:hypothetical protein